MCVNSLNIKVICTRKAAINLAVLDFCINTHTHTHTHTHPLYFIYSKPQFANKQNWDLQLPLFVKHFTGKAFCYTHY